MRELWPKNEIRKNSRNRLCTSGKLIYGSATSKIGFCLKNWPRDMCVVPILSIEAEIMGGGGNPPPPGESSIEIHRENRVKNQLTAFRSGG